MKLTSDRYSIAQAAKILRLSRQRVHKRTQYNSNQKGYIYTEFDFGLNMTYIPKVELARLIKEKDSANNGR